MDQSDKRDHGGGLDSAILTYGGRRAEWIDLSTGINPVPYPIGEISAGAWACLPDTGAFAALEQTARSFWGAPEEAGFIAAPGASALIAALPGVLEGARVDIPEPTYNEHAAAFRHHGWQIDPGNADARVLVHPNNPDGRLWSEKDTEAQFTIIDESFTDVCPEKSLIDLSAKPGRILLKSFGKFWGLAGLRLGFAFGDPKLIARLKERVGPWAVSGPALQIGARALQDIQWAQDTRKRLLSDSARLDDLMARSGATCVGGTSLFRLYQTEDANAWQDRLARRKIWSRTFPYSKTWLRLGCPKPQHWAHLEAAILSS